MCDLLLGVITITGENQKTSQQLHDTIAQYFGTTYAEFKTRCEGLQNFLHFFFLFFCLNFGQATNNGSSFPFFLRVLLFESGSLPGWEIPMVEA